MGLLIIAILKNLQFWVFYVINHQERERERERECLCLVIILYVLHSTYNFILICNNLQTFENIKVMNYKNIYLL